MIECMCYSKCGSRRSAAYIRLNNLQHFRPEPFRLKNRIREGCQRCLGFEYQIHIDSMIFLPFGPRSLFGTKNWIREGCQKCLRFEYQQLICSTNFLPFGPWNFFGAKNRIREEWQKCLRFEYQKLIDSIVVCPRLGPGAFSEPKIGSERGARSA